MLRNERFLANRCSRVVLFSPSQIGATTLREGIAFGPGKANLLQGIRDTGSIAAAGRRMGMSYTRAWGLVMAMNAHFRHPVVISEKGGAARGGASLTKAGEDILRRYRRMESSAGRAVAADLAAQSAYRVPIESPRELFAQPRTPRVAEILGLENS